MTETAPDFGLKALAEFWGQAGKMALQAQGEAGRAFADAIKTMTGPPGSGASGPGLSGSGPSESGPMGFAMPASGATDDIGRAGQTMTELWSAVTALSGTLAATLHAAGNATGKATDPTIDATFRAMVDPASWIAAASGMEGVAGRFAEGPKLADLWSTERQQSRVVQAWTEMRRCTLEHNAIVLQAWMRAGNIFAQELAGRGFADGRAADSKAMLSRWSEIANQVLLETQRSEPFLRTQAAVIRAGTEQRLAQRDMAERWAAEFDLPTRTELDDVHRTVTGLRRELRALRRAERGAVATMPTPNQELVPDGRS